MPSFAPYDMDGEVPNTIRVRNVSGDRRPMTPTQYAALLEALGLAKVTSTSAGAAGAEIDLYQNSASPAVDDVPGSIWVYANDANGTKTLIGKVLVGIKETTAGAMSSYITWMALDDGVERTMVFNPDNNAMYPLTDAFADLGIASTNRFRTIYVSGGVQSDGAVNTGTGYQYNGTAASGNTLRGDGTNFISQQLALEDLTSVAWTTYSPTITSATGTLTTASGAGRYRLIGKMLFLNVSATITTNGTGATSILIPLPASLTAVAVTSILGRESAVNGKTAGGTIAASGGSITCRNYDNTYPGQDGAVITMTGVIEVN